MPRRDAITAINRNGPSFGLIGAATEIVGIKNVDLIGGQVNMFTADFGVTVPQHKAGKIRGLAVTSSVEHC